MAAQYANIGSSFYTIEFKSPTLGQPPSNMLGWTRADEQNYVDPT